MKKNGENVAVINDVNTVDVLKSILLFNKTSGNKSSKLIPCLYGSTGVGKTTIIEQVGKELGIPVVRLLLHSAQPGEILGIPKVVNNKTIWSLPEWVTNDEVIVFLDELDKPHQDLIGEVLTLIAENRVRNHVFPKMLLVAAMQPVDADEFLSTETGKALAARLCFIRVSRNSGIEYIERKYGLKLDRLKTNDESDFPILIEPSPRQLEWICNYSAFEPRKNILKLVASGIFRSEVAEYILQQLEGGSVLNKKEFLLEKLRIAISSGNYDLFSSAEFVELFQLSEEIVEEFGINIFHNLFERMLQKCGPDEVFVAMQRRFKSLYEEIDNKGEARFLGDTPPEYFAIMTTMLVDFFNKASSQKLSDEAIALVKQTQEVFKKKMGL